jgi:hypothetical protein
MGSYAEILIAFAMVGLLGLILRFTFGRDSSTGADSGRDDSSLELSEDAYVVVSEEPAATPLLAPLTSPTPPAPSADAAPDDFGLLAPVAVTDDAEEAARLKARLTEARIRATTTRGADGRYRVLVFSTELDRARRVGGGTP